ADLVQGGRPLGRGARATAALGGDPGGPDPAGGVPAAAAVGTLHADVRVLPDLPHLAVAVGGEDLATAAAGDLLKEFPDCLMLTPQQQQAVSCRDVSVVLSSGAGCGKTHVLTRRYLSHLEQDGAEVGQIVAITFTDRAARQMRERIRQAVLDHLRAAPND